MIMLSGVVFTVFWYCFFLNILFEIFNLTTVLRKQFPKKPTQEIGYHMHKSLQPVPS